MYFFGFDIDAMVGSEDSTNTYQSLNVSIGTVIGNLEIFKFVPDHLKTKKNIRLNKRVAKLFLQMMEH